MSMKSVNVSNINELIDDPLMESLFSDVDYYGDYDDCDEDDDGKIERVVLAKDVRFNGYSLAAGEELFFDRNGQFEGC